LILGCGDGRWLGVVDSLILAYWLSRRLTGHVSQQIIRLGGIVHPLILGYRRHRRLDIRFDR
jgi:hypothetical protein